MVTFGPSASEVAFYSSVLLVHTYTRTPVSDGAADAWQEAAPVSGTVVPGLPCAYRTSSVTPSGAGGQSGQRLRTDADGQVTIDLPFIYVAPADPLAVGDLVSDIQNQAGVAIAAGPFAVESIDSRDLAGALIWRRARLRRAVAV